jgi:hypothetical protein
MAVRMSCAREITAVACAVRHCTEYGCQKCAARARWNRRKKRNSPKSSVCRATGRK